MDDSHLAQVAPPAAGPKFNYPGEDAPIYAIAAGADAQDLINFLDRRLGHLDTMLTMTYGDGGEAFRGYNDQIQDDYMWSCSHLAGECRELFQQVLHAMKATAPE